MGLGAGLIGAAVLGAAATAYSVNEQKKSAKKQARRLDKQKQEAKDAARERALLQGPRDETGAKIALGRQDTEPVAGSGAGSGAATSRTGSVKSRTGGLGSSSVAGGLKQQTRKRIGL